MKKLTTLILALVFALSLTVQAFAVNSRVPEAQPGDAFSFLYFGDIQIAVNAEADYAAWEELASAAVARNPDVAFVLQGGDIVESGINERQWELFLNAAEAALGDIPFFPTVGNHERNFLSGKPELFLQKFDLPQNGPEGFKGEFYSFTYGNVHVQVLNSWVFSGEQRLTDEDFMMINQWVAEDLANSDAEWKIAVTHVPPYPVHRDRTGIAARENWEGIFVTYGLDVCFVGHQHVYSRLKPMKYEAPDYYDGVTYIMGNSGQKHYSSADETYAERTIYNTTNYQLARVDGNSMTIQTFDADGNELDYIALTPRGSRTLTRGMFVDEFLPDAIIHGYGNGNLGLEDAITNEQIAALLWRAADEKAIGDAPGSGIHDPSPWAAEYWEWALSVGLFAIDADPRGTAARRDVLSVISGEALSVV